ncbi:MAG: ABC transporter permease [Actinomycetia bacterium]|nr:ABC transporter permease [Actinomycetes bacterium]
MWRFVVNRLAWMIVIVIFISMLSFLIIEAPPGDFMTVYAARLAIQGDYMDEAAIASLRSRYGLDQPIYVKYYKWASRIVRGDLGFSFEWRKPVSELLKGRLIWSIVISLTSILFVYIVAIPIGVFSATHLYSKADYFFNLIGFIGLSVPNFLFALVLLWAVFERTGTVAVGLFSKEYIMASWSIGRVIDLIKHLWMPAIVLGTAGTAGMIRVMRANLLDELPKAYVMVARSKGLSELRLLYKYPFRIAMNPVISTIGWALPAIFSGEVLVSLVLGIPTIAPIFLQSLLSQDMYLAGSIVLILSVLTVIGTFISDILLAWLDPRIQKTL